jgi:hypothetical protein
MSLYLPKALLDKPYGHADLEWLYRPRDVDGSSLSSRFANLAPVSFTNSFDGVRRRRLFATESWESNQFVWANDNPQNVFPFNSRFAPTANASFAVASAELGSYVAAPSLAHADRKINLNYPLPVSNDPDEPIRHKWITETYQLLKWILPPRAVDTPEELAQLSQFVINIVDFRDPDCTMTHWQNPDVVLVPGPGLHRRRTQQPPRSLPRRAGPGGSVLCTDPAHQGLVHYDSRRSGGWRLRRPGEQREVGAAGSCGRPAPLVGQTGGEPSNAADRLFLRRG